MKASVSAAAISKACRLRSMWLLPPRADMVEMPLLLQASLSCAPTIHDQQHQDH